MKNNPLPRLDKPSAIRDQLLAHCRIQAGETWVDPVSGHKVACIDCTDQSAIHMMMDGAKAQLAVHDPPYNLVAFAEQPLSEFIEWCKLWVQLSWDCLADDASFYVWLGADQKNAFQPFPDFMIMMREFAFQSRSFVTLRNQRGYGTQKNWMAIRQELLYYTKGKPSFDVQYTDIPKVVKGYYKAINGERVNNSARGKSDTIRPGNVWMDVQQIFYRMQENVSGCYAQKPLRSINRIVEASSAEGDLVLDFFSHSGATLLSAEMLGRKAYVTDIDPLFCEITIRRLEHYRATGKTGWQNSHPFEELNLLHTQGETL